MTITEMIKELEIIRENFGDIGFEMNDIEAWPREVTGVAVETSSVKSAKVVTFVIGD